MRSMLNVARRVGGFAALSSGFRLGDCRALADLRAIIKRVRARTFDIRVDEVRGRRIASTADWLVDLYEQVHVVTAHSSSS
jgi:hypothetical protein